MAKHVDEPMSVEFQLPKSEEDLQPGQPLWANYVKGVIAFFPHKGLAVVLFYIDVLISCCMCIVQCPIQYQCAPLRVHRAI